MIHNLPKKHLKVYSVNVNERDFRSLEERHDIRVKSFLYTFAEIGQLKKFEKFAYDGCEILIDSGAYSAWSSGKTIDIHEYISFLKEKIRLYESMGIAVTFATLDVIPGKKGQASVSQKEVQDAAAAGFSNLKVFLRHFPKELMLHAFHEGEDWDYFRRYLDMGLYIGVSPSNDSSLKKKKEWLRAAFAFADSTPFRSHGFGVTAHSLVRCHPWYSVDSLSWRMSSMNGGVLTPKGSISLSDRTVTSLGEDGFFGGEMQMSKDAKLSPEKKLWLEKYVTAHGYTMEELRSSWFDRGVLSLLFNVKYFPTLFADEMYNSRVYSQETFSL